MITYLDEIVYIMNHFLLFQQKSSRLLYKINKKFFLNMENAMTKIDRMIQKRDFSAPLISFLTFCFGHLMDRFQKFFYLFFLGEGGNRDANGSGLFCADGFVSRIGTMKTGADSYMIVIV